MAGLLLSLASFAQTLSTSGTWTATTVSTQTVDLTGNISLAGTITIPNGVTLTINSNGAARNIINNASTTLENMFNIQKGGTLKILGTSSYKITIGGGANFEHPSADYLTSVNDLSTPSGKTQRFLTGPAIFNKSGTLLLQYVQIQNVYNNRSLGGGNDSNYAGAVCHTSDNGAATSTTLQHCNIINCKSRFGVGLHASSLSQGQVTVEDTNFSYCIAWENSSYGTHGAIVRSWGNSCSHMKLKNVKIHHCYSVWDCGAIYWPANGMNTDGNYATLTLDGCEFYNNRSESNAGALDICANLRLENNVTKVHHNICTGTKEDSDGQNGGVSTNGGGGMSVRPYSSAAQPDYSVDVTFDLSNLLEVYENQAKTGGGIAIYGNSTTLHTGSTFTINLNGVKVYDNHAIGDSDDNTKGNGGGIYINNGITSTDYTFSFNLNSGEVYNNTAVLNGGGIYASNYIITSNGGDNVVKVHDNTANLSGGGMYIDNAQYTMNGGEIYDNEAKGLNSDIGRGGGIMVTGKKLVTINGGKVYNNTAKYGGGLAIDASVSGSSTDKFIFANGEIYGNTASANGGGINIHKISGTSGTIKFTGGNIYSNTCSNSGGGLCVNCDAIVKFSDGNIHNNTGKSGGGITLLKGAQMTFSRGKVIQNNAMSSATVQTGYHLNSGTSGLGGGIYITNTDGATNSTTFTIFNEDIDNVQIYGNLASNGADDIYASGNHTSFSAPNPEGITLTNGFVSQGWFEDYVTGDTEYANGTNVMGTSVSPSNIIRYRDAVSRNLAAYDASNLLTGSYTEYACLTLGYKPIDITVTKKGLKAGESATFDLFDGDDVKRYQLILTGVAGQDAVSQTITYQPSNQTMKVKETSWGWSYKPKSGTPTEISQNISDADKRTFTFENVKNTKVLHSESIKENVFSNEPMGTPIKSNVSVDPLDDGGTQDVDFD